ncbi:NADH:flavin oxidoreductase / NADH oxidase family protein [Moraxella cuniculi DSM 21768]|uniref:NADH:flavin oxidoreductase / NADH oxidase family protein n=1 Tax=Moraxella cuniculi DSM 21768 TaxID=1122245 RepID=A0A1N7D949_9GAMM|nr:hypothetical protein [Moraxella cuniculi]SIR72338.1 NADH:flavin oxidoreductase / NADH oxidase family protein [Moraxella cuniculi DSM 21768]
MSDDEVEQMVASFARAAELVMQAGFDGVEIHGANGWLIQQFVSAATNFRQDRWGGSLENRLRFPLAIVDAIDQMRQKHHRPDFIIGYRFSPEEPGERGITMKETLTLVDRLLEKTASISAHFAVGFLQKSSPWGGCEPDPNAGSTRPH